MSRTGKTKQLVTDAFLAGILFALQVALMHLPNMELVSLLTMLYTVIFGKRVVIILTVFIMLEGLVHGFGVWWISYLYIWYLLAGGAWILRKMQAPDWGYAILSGIFGLSFGFFCSIPYLSGGIGAALSWWISGIPFDIIHGISNLVIAFLLFRPLGRVLRECKIWESR